MLDDVAATDGEEWVEATKTLASIAHLQTVTGNYQLAARSFEECIVITKLPLGADPPTTTHMCGLEFGLAAALDKAGSDDRAQPL